MQKKMEMSEENSNQSNKNPVTKETLHGTIYQLKLLMIFFRRGFNEEDFKIFNEIETAEKFEDFIFQCKNVNKKKYSFFQVKYFQNINKKITAIDFLAEKGSFNIQKLFQFYQRIKKNIGYEGMEKNFVVCTNIDIDKHLQNCFEEVNDESEILTHDNQSSRLLKFKIQNFPRCDDLVRSLRNSSEVRRFATALARWAFEEKKLILNQDHILYFHGSILREIIEVHRSKIIQPLSCKCAKRVEAKFRKEFLRGDQEKLLRIRKAFFEAVMKMSKNALDEEQVWVKMEEKVLQITEGFAKKLEESSSSEVTNFALPDDNVSDKDIEDFFENLRYVVSQPNEVELKKVIKTEIRKGKQVFKMINTPFIASEFQKHVLYWMKKKQNKCLTQKDGEDFFRSAKSKLSVLWLIGQCLEFKVIIKNFDIAFNEKLPELESFLLSSRKQIFNLINPYKPALSLIKVVTILNSTEQYKKAGSYIIISLKSSLVIKDVVTNTFKELHLLVIECDTNEENIGDFFTKLSTELEKSANNKIILITQKDNTLANTFKKKFHPDKYEEKYDNFNKLTDLAIKSQKKLLNKGKVQFEGEEVSLKDLIDDGAKELINGEILFQLFKGEKIEVGKKRPGLYDLDLIYHITSVNIDMKQLSYALKNNDNDLFVFSGINEDELSQIIPDQDLKVEKRICLFREDVFISEHKYVILTEDEDEEKCIGDFKQICRDYSLLKAENLHFSAYLIRKKNNILTWICSYNPFLYMNRKLYQVVIKGNSLRKIINKKYTVDQEQEKRDIFAISNIKENEFENYYHIKVSNVFPADKESIKANHIYILHHKNEENSFRRFCNHKDLKKYYNIHWLQNKEQNGINYLIWRLSEGELDVITKLKQVEVDEMCIDEKELRTKKAVIIAGDAGVGKSTTLAHFLRQPNELEWVLKLDLINFEKQLSELNNMKYIDDFIESFFSKINIGMEGKFAKSLFKHKVISQGKITFLFDGFDEITAKSQKTMIKLLKLLKNSKANFRITTRLHDEGKLEKCLSMPSYTFRPSTSEDQQHFFYKFWKIGVKFSDVSNDHILEKAKVFSTKSEEADWKVMRIPLIMRMFAEVYQEVIEKLYKCDNQDEFEDMKNLSMSYVYERFIRRKYDMYLKEKGKVPDCLKNKLTFAFNKDHQILSFWKLFPQYAEILTNKYEQLSSEDKNCLTSIGIVKAGSSNTDLYFTHQTFAEYFAARFLFRMMKETNNSPKYMEAYKLLLFEVLDNKYELIRELIGEMTKIENLVSKWKEVHDRSFVKARKKQRVILVSDKVHDCSLSDLQKLVVNCCDGNLKAVATVIEGFVHRFIHTTDIEQLKTALNFLFRLTTQENIASSLNEVHLLDKMSTAVMHFFNQSKQSGVPVEEEFKEICINRVISEVFSNFKEVFQGFEEFPTDYNLPQVIDFLIPSKELNGVEPAEWIKLNNLYYFLEIFSPDFIERIKSFIDFEMTIQERYAERVLNSLKSTKFPRSYMINAIDIPLNLKSLQSLFLHIIADPRIIAHIKSKINQIFENESRSWLEKQGIFISRCLQILTDEMSKKLVFLLSQRDEGTAAYSKCLLEFLVYPIVGTLRKKELPHIDKVALMNTLENSFLYSLKCDGLTFLTHEKLQSMLQFVEKLLDEKHQDDEVLSMISRYIMSLDRAGLQLFRRGKKLFISNSLPESLYDFSSSHAGLIIGKIRNIKNCTEPQINVTETSCVRAESSASGQKRKSSEINLAEFKILKIEEEDID